VCVTDFGSESAQRGHTAVRDRTHRGDYRTCKPKPRHLRPFPFELGEPRSFRGLTLVPLYPAAEPVADYIGLDEAAAGGLTISEVDEAGTVESLLVANPLGSAVLLYEGEELVGAKQNRVFERSILVGASSKLEIPARCVEAGRWGYRSRRFAPAPRAAYPELRKVSHLHGPASQSQVWAELDAKSARLEAHSPTRAAEEMYTQRSASLDEYLQALPRLDGQAGAIVGIAGELVCLDYVSRSDAFASLYLNLLRGYALSAIERRSTSRSAGATSAASSVSSSWRSAHAGPWSASARRAC
jgi:hypothetical protein